MRFNIIVRFDMIDQINFLYEFLITHHTGELTIVLVYLLVHIQAAAVFHPKYGKNETIFIHYFQIQKILLIVDKWRSLTFCRNRCTPICVPFFFDHSVPDNASYIHANRKTPDRNRSIALPSTNCVRPHCADWTVSLAWMFWSKSDISSPSGVDDNALGTIDGFSTAYRIIDMCIMDPIHKFA